MEFGRITTDELSGVDFSLPADRADTTRILAASSSLHPTPQIFVGCAKWGRKDWVGKIYPKGTKDADFLNHYAKHFNCIELNATFYRMPTFAQTSGWKNKVGPDFKFCPKFVDQITHIRRLKETKELLDRFFEGISGFGDNLGPIFLMPHPGMGPKTLETIETFLQSLPKDIQVFTELRHTQWFEDQVAFDNVFHMLERQGSGAIITDASGRRDCVHMRLTTPEVFIRFVGNGLHPTDYTRVDDWVQRIKSWMAQGIQKVYFFMHQHEELHSPELSKYVIQQLNLHCGLSIPEPVFVKAEPSILEAIDAAKRTKKIPNQNSASKNNKTMVAKAKPGAKKKGAREK
ncbi:DUF72 domain-containing protein [Pseudochryseolinea flava]|uniref:DUF72 domain-containing protein n=1 Tax=Pseudochryseolinea flava TaxID=2059302 RepID=A0A364XWC9_9BACT|nr:DUF72 domain-containing protein [Pseudochryseolinea flava]RAV98638.1 DUF72 domain-containing protein [Pseudochryseolinea flava]